MTSPVSSPEALLAATRRFNRASFSRIQAMNNGEISHPEWHLLWTLSQWPDAKGARPSELAHKQHVTAGNVAQQLRHLEQQGLIKREQNDDDRRVVLVTLTAQGRKKLAQVRSEFVREFAQLIRHLGPKQTDNFIRLLTEGADYLEAASRDTKEKVAC